MKRFAPLKINCSMFPFSWNDKIFSYVSLINWTRISTWLIFIDKIISGPFSSSIDRNGSRHQKIVMERNNFSRRKTEFRERERAKKIKRKNLFFLPVHTSLRGIGSKRFMEHGYKVLWWILEHWQMRSERGYFRAVTLETEYSNDRDWAEESMKKRERDALWNANWDKLWPFDSVTRVIYARFYLRIWYFNSFIRHK